MGNKHPNGKASPGKGRLGGFWDRSDPRPAIVSVHLSTSRFAKCLAFLRQVAGRVLRKG